MIGNNVLLLKRWANLDLFVAASLYDIFVEAASAAFFSAKIIVIISFLSFLLALILDWQIFSVPNSKLNRKKQEGNNNQCNN
jgi:hypothetical protein